MRTASFFCELPLRLPQEGKAASSASCCVRMVINEAFEQRIP